MKSKKAFVIIISIMFLTTTINAMAIDTFDKKTSEENLSAGDICKWTVMYYMAGDNLGMDPYISLLLENLSTLGSDENLNIVSMSDTMQPGDSKLYFFDEAGFKIELNEEFGWPTEINTADLNTFELFCIQMMNKYPAEHYALITFSAGGAGWQEIPFNDRDDLSKIVTYPMFSESLDKIVTQTGKKIDVLVGSCAFNMLEIGYEISPYVNYLIGTQDCFPHEKVIPMFFDLVSDLKNNTEMTPEEFAIRGPANHQAVSFIYMEGYGEPIGRICKLFDKLPFAGLHSVYHHTSVGVINNSEVVELAQELDDLSSLLLLNLNDDDVNKGISKARDEVQELGKCSPTFPRLKMLYRRYPIDIIAYDCFVDFYDIIDKIKDNVDNEVIKNQCFVVLDQINKTVPMVSGVENISSCGMNIYFPDSSFMYNRYKNTGKIPSPYEELCISQDTLWDEFLKTYLDTV